MSLDDMDGGINTGKMIMGGIAAGVVIDVGEGLSNLVLFAADFADLQESMGVAAPSGTTIMLFNLFGLALGLGTAWMYGAIRPRFGPGPKTGICAGLAVWGFFYLMNGIAQNLMGLYPMGLMLKVLAFQAVFMCAAGYVAGMLYKEG
jgi:hypothetical protein